MTENAIGTILIESAIEVHRQLGPGLLESAYGTCLKYEVMNRGLFAEIQVPVPLYYKGIKMECGYRIDFLAENKVIAELKSVESLTDVHLAQLLTYMKLTGCKLGYLINFNVKWLKNGIRRVILGDLSQEEPANREGKK